MSKYQIEDLIKIFSKHAEKYEKAPKFDDQEDFNLPEAFVTICSEIDRLKKELETLSNQ